MTKKQAQAFVNKYVEIDRQLHELGEYPSGFRLIASVIGMYDRGYFQRQRTLPVCLQLVLDLEDFRPGAIEVLRQAGCKDRLNRFQLPEKQQ